METEIITLAKVPLKVLSFGGLTPSRLAKNPTMKPDEMILIFPGNPGKVAFYEKFACRLFEKTHLPVWVVSSPGHENLPSPSLKANPHLYSLHGNLVQKQELIETYLKGVTLRCIGHSIGARIMLDVLKSCECRDQIETGYLLFPTIEHMRETSIGQHIQRLIDYWQYLLLPLSAFIRLFPYFVLNFIAWVYCALFSVERHNIRVLVDFATSPRSIRTSIYLTSDEFQKVRERDDKTILKHKEKLRFYYGKTDAWTPLSYYENLKENVPGVNVTLAEDGIPHSFVLNYSHEVANVVAEWIQIDKKNKK